MNLAQGNGFGYQRDRRGRGRGDRVAESPDLKHGKGIGYQHDFPNSYLFFPNSKFVLPK